MLTEERRAQAGGSPYCTVVRMGHSVEEYGAHILTLSVSHWIVNYMATPILCRDHSGSGDVLRVEGVDPSHGPSLPSPLTSQGPSPLDPSLKEKARTSALC